MSAHDAGFKKQKQLFEALLGFIPDVIKEPVSYDLGDNGSVVINYIQDSLGKGDFFWFRYNGEAIELKRYSPSEDLSRVVVILPGAQDEGWTAFEISS